MSSGKQMKKTYKAFNVKAKHRNVAADIMEFFNSGFDNELRIQVVDPGGSQRRIFGRVVEVLICGNNIDGVFLKVHSDRVKRKDKKTQRAELVSGDSIMIVPLASVIQAFSISFKKEEELPRNPVETIAEEDKVKPEDTEDEEDDEEEEDDDEDDEEEE